MNPFHFITEQAARDIVASHPPLHIPAVDSRRPAQGHHRLARIMAKAALLAALLFPFLGAPVLAASDMFAPVGGSGFTAFREINGSLEFVSVDAIGARRLHDRGFSVDESVSFTLDAPASVFPQRAQVLPPADPTGVIVAVVDTGVDPSHPWFNTHLLPGRSFIGAPEDWSDTHGHGTHVAGIVRQADPSARILPVRVLGRNGGWDFDIAAGIVWAVENGARVVNLSLGGTSPSSALDTAIEFAHARDVVVVAAAGNLGDMGSPPSYPAANELTLAVAAFDAAQAPAYFSNRGVYVDIAALGVRVTSSVPGGGFSAWSGTSMAAPFVAGAAARLRAARADIDAVATRGHLEATSRDLGERGRDDVFGWGAVDADRAIAEAANLLVPRSPESAGQLQVRMTSRVGAIVLHIDSPTSSFRVYVDGELRRDDRTSPRARLVIPALQCTALTIEANDPEGRAYETLITIVSPLPVAEPVVSLERSRQSVKVTAVLPKVEGAVYLFLKSDDGELPAIWLRREGKARLVSHQFTSPRRISWTVTVCLVIADDLVCGVATTNR
jgi:hypothetical protein